MTFLLDQEGGTEFPRMSREYNEEFYGHVRATEEGLEALCGEDSFQKLLHAIPPEKPRATRTGGIKEEPFPFN